MTDLATVQLAITSLKNAIDITRFLSDSKTTLGEAETKLKLADLMTALAEAKIELASVQDLLIAQAREIRELKDKTAFAGQMQFEQPYYFNVSVGKKDGPYCQPCWDSKKSAVRLNGQGAGFWYCHVCKTSVTDKNYNVGDVYAAMRSSE